MEYNFTQLHEELRQQLPKKRFLHTLGVEYTCACLSMRYGINIYQAQMGGLLHDCAKYLPDEEILSRCKQSKLPITPIEERNPYLLHAKLGALFAKEKYAIQDEEILDAITYHTTGKSDMTLLEKIVFIADYIEPSRKLIPGLEEIRQVAFVDLDITMYRILENTLCYLCKEKGKREIDPLTEKAYKYYKEILDKKGEKQNEQF
jgi:predicted HD superfamily hydrolase involved in NAD metabolism